MDISTLCLIEVVAKNYDLFHIKGWDTTSEISVDHEMNAATALQLYIKLGKALGLR